MDTPSLSSSAALKSFDDRSYSGPSGRRMTTFLPDDSWIWRAACRASCVLESMYVSEAFLYAAKQHNHACNNIHETQLRYRCYHLGGVSAVGCGWSEFQNRRRHGAWRATHMSLLCAGQINKTNAHSMAADSVKHMTGDFACLRYLI